MDGHIHNEKLRHCMKVRAHRSPCAFGKLEMAGAPAIVVALVSACTDRRAAMLRNLLIMVKEVH